jgi:hypothetical protein
MKTILQFAFVVTFGIASAAFVRGETISVADAGFESPTTTSWATNAAPTGWTKITVSGIDALNYGCGYCANGSAMNSPLATDGTQVAFLKGASGMYQSLSGFTVGQTYEVSFYAAGRVGAGLAGARVNTIQVLVGDTVDTLSALTFTVSGATTTTLTPAVAYYTSAAGSVGTWTLYTATFTATSATQILEFLSTLTADTNADKTTFIDSVSVTTVPEPSTTVLSLITGVGLLAFAWRKWRQCGASNVGR